VHNVSQWPNPRHLGELLGGAEGLLEAVSFSGLALFEAANECSISSGKSNCMVFKFVLYLSSYKAVMHNLRATALDTF